MSGECSFSTSVSVMEDRQSLQEHSRLRESKETWHYMIPLNDTVESVDKTGMQVVG